MGVAEEGRFSSRGKTEYSTYSWRIVVMRRGKLHMVVPICINLISLLFFDRHF